MTPREILKQYWGTISSGLCRRRLLHPYCRAAIPWRCCQQVENLKARGIAAMAIVSGMGRREVDIALDNCIYGPWGYDFRPPYLHIARLRELHPAVPVLALTASATADEAEDKLRKLLDVAHGITGSGIVYVRTRKETFEIAQHYRRHHISADYYHAGLPADERAEKQDAWKSNATRIIVATNAFGMGIDKPDVRFVIHKDMPDSLEAYYQEAGRAGRDEDKAYAVLLYHPADRALRGISFDLDIAEFCSRFELDAIKTLNALKFLEQDEYVSFTESVFLPSRFRFEVLNEELYNFQIQNPGWDPFVKTLLRSYGGSFENYVRIKEFDIARRAGMSVQQVVTGLQQLQAFDILSYLPQTDQPQITWLKPRQPNNHLYINKVAIEQRKATYRKKLDAVFAYTGTPVCRSRQLLTYFDEPEAPKCGICDVCLEERRQQNSGEITDHITSEIVQALSNGPHTIAELIPALKYDGDTDKVKVYNKYYAESALVQSRNGVLRISSYAGEKLVVWVTVNDLRFIEAYDNASVTSFGKLSKIELDVNLHNGATADLKLDAYKANITVNDAAKAQLAGNVNDCNLRYAQLPVLTMHNS
ncbi:hypothetical protein Lal_00049317 [Lupinus albus]|nr:hypothetical protein Lal_00049317 [Lupinus albus]